MAKFYIQLQGKLVPVGKITEEDIKEALGVEKLFNFSGDFYELDNNPFKDESNGELKIVDPEGRIIAIVDKDGIHSIEMTAIKSGITHNLTEKMDVSEFESIITVDESGKFVIEDENGNEGLKLDSTGLYVKDVTAGKHVLSQKADLDDINFNNLVDNPIHIDDTGEFVIEDESGYKGFILNKSGVEAKDFTTSDGVSLNDVDNRVNSIQGKVESINEMISDDEEDRLIIRDGDGEVGLELNKDGLYVKDVTTRDSEGNPKDVLSKKLDKSEFTEIIGVVEGRVDTNESNITNLSNTVNSNKSQINSIQGEVDSINEMISDAEESSFIVSDSNDYIGLKLDQEGLYVKDVITLNEGDEEHRLSKKANQSDVDTINKNLDTLNSTVESHTSQIGSIGSVVDKKLDKSTFEEVIDTKTSDTVKVLYDGENVGLTVNASGISTSGDVIANGHKLKEKANQSYVKGVEKRLSDIETLLVEDSDNIINNIRDVIDYFENVSESEVGDALIKSVSENTNNIRKNADDIKQLSEDVDKLDESVNGLNNTIEGLDKEVDSLKGVVNTNVTNITNLTSTVNTHTSNIKAINDNISLIEDDVDTINDMISDSEESSFIVSDNNDYIGLKLDQEGLHVKDVITYTKEGEKEHKLSEKANQSDVDAISVIKYASASVDSNVGTPSVTVSLTGDDVKNKTLNFEFKNLKGDKGVRGASVSSISVVGNLEHGSGKTNTYELTDSDGKRLIGDIEVQDGVDGIGIKYITKKESSDSDSDLVDTYTITYTDDDKEPYDFYVTNGKDGHSILYTSFPCSKITAGIQNSNINTYGRTIQVGDLILSSNGNIFSVKGIESPLSFVGVEYLTSIKGVEGASVSSIVCVDGDNSENLADVNNEDGAINYYRIKDNNNNFLEGTIAIKNGSSGSEDDSSDSDGEFVDIDIPFEEDESGKFVIIDDSADENIGLILDSEGVTAKDFITSSNISLNDVGDRLSVVEDSIGIEQITYDNLVQLRNDKLLIPGKKYRITDYVTTTTQENTLSAKHQFDIIVTALTENELSEIASACYHEENYNEDNLENLYISEFNSEYGWEGGGCTFSHSGIRYIDGNIYIEYEDNNNNILIFDFNDKSKVYFDSDDVIKFIPSYYIAPEYGYNDLTENNVSLLGGDDFYVPYISTYDNMIDGNETRISISIRKEFNRNYFKNLGCNLSAWEIWYSLDNSDRFAWSDVENGKGVIYRMIDEWGNDCPYDFKNIQFTNKTDDEIITSYTFSWSKEITMDMTSSISKGIDIKDTSIAGNNGLLLNFGGNIPGVHNNVIKPYIPIGETENNKQYLNNICFCGYGVTFRGYNNNSFGNNCFNNTFGDNCHDNTFGNECYSNIFGNGFQYNSFGNNCNNNTSSISFHNNTFGDVCVNNTFGNGCAYNIFGNMCHHNTFGNGCASNTFSNQCMYNTFGINCAYNTFGNACGYNKFGYMCHHNTFGDDCEKIIFGNSESTPSSYYKNIIIDNGNCYINLNCTSTTGSSNYYQNVRIGLGVNNTTTIKTINDPNVGQTYETLYRPANSQTITI